MRPVLFELVDGSWTPRAQLPAQAAAPGTAIRLAIIGRLPYAAYTSGPQAITITRLQDDRWTTIASIHSDVPVANMSLLHGASSPVLWVGHVAPGDDALYFLPEPGAPGSQDAPTTQPAGVALKAIASPAAERSVDFACGQIHRIWIDRSEDPTGLGRVLDQAIDQQTGVVVGSPAPLTLPRKTLLPEISNPTRLVLWGALVFAVFSSLRWRRDPQAAAASLENFELAGYGPRLIAGAIDLLPMLAAVAVQLSYPDLVPHQLLLSIGLLVYLLHTALLEMLLGRSIGKLCTGLAVVSFAGKTPSRGALLLRNALRLIDVIFMIPLITILVSPLRQRTGDVAAGTVVVRRRTGVAADDKSLGEAGKQEQQRK